MKLSRSRHLWLFVASPPARCCGADLSAGLNTASADADSHAIVTLTKWVTDPNAGTMKGVVGGDVGAGTYTGQILSSDADHCAGPNHKD